jgi:hypothetical protein
LDFVPQVRAAPRDQPYPGLQDPVWKIGIEQRRFANGQQAGEG